MKKVIIIQARTGSSRLPRKVLADIEGKPMLLRVIERVLNCKHADDVVVATTILKDDSAIEHLCISAGVACFRGDENNVLNRYYSAAKYAAADLIVRITADCPLIMPEIIDECIETFMGGAWDCISPRSKDGLIRGLDCEVFSFKVLEKAEKETVCKTEREHVTLHFYNNPTTYKIFSLPINDIYKGSIRLCVDELKDLSLIREIYSRLSINGQAIDIKQVIELLKREPLLAAMNQNIEQRVFCDKNRK